MKKVFRAVIASLLVLMVAGLGVVSLSMGRIIKTACQLINKDHRR